MQKDSTSKSETDEIKPIKQLNVNAPIFEPKQQILNPADPIWSKLQNQMNIKSTLLVPPQRQHFMHPVTNYNSFATYICPPSSPYHQTMKPEFIGPSNGSNTFYPLSTICMDPNVYVAPQSQIVTDPHSTTNNIGTSTPPLSVDQKEISKSSQISKPHSIVDRPIQTQPVPQPLGIEVNQPLLIPQNNLTQLMWPSCSQSPQVALFTHPYYPPNSLYLFRPQPLPYTTLNSHPVSSLSQNRSTLKISIRDRIFNTGDPELDVLLNELVTRINPVDEFVFRSKNSRFFVIKSFTEDNIYQSIRHGVWCSTPTGNETLVAAYRQVLSRAVDDDETSTPHVYLFFSVNGSGYFCGVAEMTSELHSESGSGIWNQKKWQSRFSVAWRYIKDVPNSYLRQIKLESNENRPVTNCRDATEIFPLEKGIEVLRIIHNIHYDTCLLNDFVPDPTASMGATAAAIGATATVTSSAVSAHADQS